MIKLIQQHKLSTLILALLGIGWLLYFYQIQPFAYWIQKLGIVASLFILVSTLHPIIKDLLPAYSQLSQQFESSWNLHVPLYRKSKRWCLLQCQRYFGVLSIVFIVALFQCFGVITLFLAPHFQYKNPNVIIFNRDAKDNNFFEKEVDAIIVGLQTESFLQKVELKQSTLPITGTQELKVPIPKHINAIFCTRSTEITAKELAKRLIKQGIGIQFIGASQHQDKAIIQFGRSIRPFVSIEHLTVIPEPSTLTPEQIDQASCS